MPHQVVIVSPNSLQNDMLARAVTKETGISCRYVEHLEQIHIKSESVDKSTLALCDHYSLQDNDLLSCLAACLPPNNHRARHLCALFNVVPKSFDELEALKLGLQGLFFFNTQLACLIRGIDAIFRGELWFSRKALAAYVRETRHYSCFQPKSTEALTPRELEILQLIGHGLNNQEIADELTVSMSTVKSHINNLYHKLNLSSRTEAILFANK